jgi:hypothetical protein
LDAAERRRRRYADLFGAAAPMVGGAGDRYLQLVFAAAF